MAVNYLIFGNADSRDFDIEVFYNDIDRTPKRVYERVEVPNRNGAILIDAKRYEDVPVSYDCIALDDDDRKAFLNALASQIGYKRMEDSFNSDEYYSAVFEGDVDPNMTVERDKSTFTVYFTRKPQRWLKAGETAVSVESGDDITNPTLFASSPMLEVEAPNGGNIFINGDVSVSLTNSPLGRVMLVEGANRAIGGYDASFDGDLLNAGNEIYIDKAKMSFVFHSKKKIGSATKTNESGDAETKSEIANDEYNIYGSILFEGLSFVNGTASQYSRTFKISVTATDGTTGLEEVQGTISYDGNNNILMGPMLSADGSLVVLAQSALFDSSDIEAESTILPLGQTAYIDCDSGECYIISNGVPYSINRIVSFGSKLPTLQAGANSISYLGPQSITVIPRWWKI